ncbi:uncharacterized protein LOC108626546, partial [Ceratina calcarata]|uniref:Uncharacterized protein LOC108626546 n=1 Tax=Ceratina calcarata TaxID=156304 RepID=A0AAJ7S3L6_9HYME
MSRESWDAFKYYPLTKQSASMQDKKWLNVSIRVIKAFVYVFLFCSVLCTGLIAKFVVLFAVSQLKDEATVQFCNYDSAGKNENLQARISKKAKIVWTWYIIFMFLIPECFTIFRAIWYFLFKKKVKLPGRRSIAVSLVLEILHPVGVALLIFYELPKLNSVDAAVIFSCICVIPSLLNLLAQNRKNTSNMFLLILIINFLALIAQGTGVILLCFIHNPQDFQGWVLFIALVLSSCRWWCNYVPCSSYYGSLNFLAKSKTDNWHVFRGYTVEVIKMSSSRTNVNVLIAFSDKSVPLNSFLMQAFCAFFIYKAAKFAYQTGMHKFGFALPLTLITPGTVIIILMFCIARENDPCALHGLIPDYLFLNAPKFNSITEFLLNWRIWCWLSLWLSQVWITRQVWLGEHAKLAPVERIFHNPSYDAFFVDQFLGLNKRKHDDSHTVKKEDEEEEDEEKEEDSISEFE